MLSPKTVLITGSNRGLGLEFVRRFLKLEEPPKFIFACCRNPDEAKDLSDIANLNPSVIITQLDVTNEDSIKQAKSFVEAKVENGALNLLINNAAAGCRSSLYEFTKEEMMSCYETNTVGPLMMAREFLPLLRNAAQEKLTEELSCSKSAIINISSLLGSISMLRKSAFYPYRSSKAALNMLTANLNFDLKAEGILCTAVHPGWVRTDLGGKDAFLSIDESLDKMMSLLHKLKGDKDAGKLFDGVTGDVLGW